MLNIRSNMFKVRNTINFLTISVVIQHYIGSVIAKAVRNTH